MGESVPVKSHSQLGGVARNVAFAMFEANTGLKLTTHFICGDDIAGWEMDQQIQALRFPSVQKMTGQSTARYMSIEDQTGTVLYGLADMEIFDNFPQPEILDGDFLVTDTNPSSVFFENLNVDLPLYVVGTSPTKILHLLPVLPKVTGLLVNKQEAVALVGEALPIKDLASALATKGPSKILITQGAASPVVYENDAVTFADESAS